jgi:thymidylate synthase (FAD)
VTLRDELEVREAAMKIDVLDHGFVRLVESMGDDLSIVRAARVSYDAAWRAGEDEGSDKWLIKYLWRNKHATPFEAVEFQFEVKCPVFVARQWMRHRTWSYSEISARYTELPEDFYVPDLDKIGTQSHTNKQTREIGPESDAAVDREPYRDHCRAAFRCYHDLLRSGWPRELARGVLPLSTYTHFFAKTNLRNFLHFVALRRDPHAQFEIRTYAEAMLDLVRPVCPTAINAFETDGAQQKD